MKSSGKAVVAAVQDLPEIELTAARRPARARLGTVLQGTGDLSIKQPNSRHVSVETRGRVVTRHAELENKHLLSTTETVVGNSVGAVVTTRVTLALVAREDDELVVATDGGLGQYLRARGSRDTIRASIRERVAKLEIEGTRSTATKVVKENQIVGRLGLGIVARNKSPVRVRSGSRG